MFSTLTVKTWKTAPKVKAMYLSLNLNHGGLLSHQTFRLQLRRHFVDVPQTRLIGLQVLHMRRTSYP